MDVSVQESFQEENAWMRQRFLVLLSNLKGSKTKVKMYDNTAVNCVWETSDGTFNNIIVSQLETPRPEVLLKAVLRTGDIISLQIEKET